MLLHVDSDRDGTFVVRSVLLCVHGDRRDGKLSPGRPPRLSHSSRDLDFCLLLLLLVLLYVHRDRRDYERRQAQDAHVDFRTAPELCFASTETAWLISFLLLFLFCCCCCLFCFVLLVWFGLSCD